MHHPHFAARYKKLGQLFETVAYCATILISFLILLVCMSANAQTAGGGDPTSDQLSTQALASIQSGNGWLIAGALVSLLSWGVRKGWLQHLPGAAGVWLHDHPAAEYATPFILSAIGGVITTGASGQPWTVAGVVASVLKVGVTAVAATVGMQTVGDSREFGAARAAEVTAAADPKTAAVSLLQKGPQP